LAFTSDFPLPGNVNRFVCGSDLHPAREWFRKGNFDPEPVKCTRISEKKCENRRFFYADFLRKMADYKKIVDIVDIVVLVDLLFHKVCYIRRVRKAECFVPLTEQRKLNKKTNHVERRKHDPSRAHLDTSIGSLSPPERGEGWGEGTLARKQVASSPRPSPPFGQEREKIVVVSSAHPSRSVAPMGMRKSDQFQADPTKSNQRNDSGSRQET